MKNLILLTMLLSVGVTGGFAANGGTERYARLSVVADGRALKIEPVRCSTVPFNRRWPGHRRPKDLTVVTNAFGSFSFRAPVAP